MRPCLLCCSARLSTGRRSRPDCAHLLHPYPYPPTTPADPDSEARWREDELGPLISETATPDSTTAAATRQALTVDDKSVKSIAERAGLSESARVALDAAWSVDTGGGRGLSALQATVRSVSPAVCGRCLSWLVAGGRGPLADDRGGTRWPFSPTAGPQAIPTRPTFVGPRARGGGSSHHLVLGSASLPLHHAEAGALLPRRGALHTKRRPHGVSVTVRRPSADSSTTLRRYLPPGARSRHIRRHRPPSNLHTSHLLIVHSPPSTTSPLPRSDPRRCRVHTQ